MFGRTKKEIKIHQTLETGIWTVEIDRGKIDQVFLNIYVNAWQAMPGDLFIETRNMILIEVEVQPYKVKPGKFVMISIRDTDVGMDELTRKRIFDPFFTTKELGRGTGLGLASAYGISVNHGGIITVQSKKAKEHDLTFTCRHRTRILHAKRKRKREGGGRPLQRKS